MTRAVAAQGQAEAGEVLANERIQTNAGGQAVLKLRTTRRDSTFSSPGR